MRTLLIAAALITCLCAPVVADPILLAPSGKTLSTGQFRAEAAMAFDDENGKYLWLGTGLMQLEANVIRLDDVKGRTENQIGLQWNFMPETFATPAVAFGATDVTSESDDGIGFYIVTTKRLSLGAVNPLIKELSGTAGVGIRGIKGMFFGLEAKLPMNLSLQAEYDSREFNGAIGWQPIKMLKLKAYSIHDEFYYGLEIPPIKF